MSIIIRYCIPMSIGFFKLKRAYVRCSDFVINLLTQLFTENNYKLTFM